MASQTRRRVIIYVAVCWRVALKLGGEVANGHVEDATIRTRQAAGQFVRQDPVLFRGENLGVRVRNLLAPSPRKSGLFLRIEVVHPTVNARRPAEGPKPAE